MGVRIALLVLFTATLAGFVLFSAWRPSPPQLSPDVRLFLYVKRQAEKGDPKAQYDLAVFYGTGQGTATNEAEAMKWIRKSAASGEPKSLVVLGESYANGGKGSPQDDIEAEELFRKSAEQGWAKGQHDLACCYLDGRGVKQDDKMALEWFRKAAAQGYADSKYHLGYMVLNGRGVEKNEVEGVKWLAMAAEQNHAPAQWSLGTAYATGTGGVNQDYVQAYKWVSLALERGKGDKPALPALAEKMTKEQVKEAVRLAAEFKKTAKPLTNYSR